MPSKRARQLNGWPGLTPQSAGRQVLRRRTGRDVPGLPAAAGSDGSYTLSRAVWQESESPSETRRGLGSLLTAPPPAIEFLAQSFDLTSPDTWVLEDATVPPLRPTEDPPRAVIGCLRINDVRGLNRFLMRVNNRLGRGGLFAVRVRTLEQELADMRRASSNAVTFFLRYVAMFVVKRIPPKVKASRYLYFALTGGRNRAVSATEALGRLVYCGFTIVDTREIDGMLYIVARREREPARKAEPSYWPIFKMPRIGLNGRIIGVYKLRTMFPYADTLQAYVYERNKLADGGKLQGDFRVTEWGRVFRRLWLDELPMLLNWFKGELKFVGVRPLSQHYASLYPPDLFEYRKQFKPGLVPPFYADLPRTFEEIIRSEERYLRAYEQSPLATDCRYLARAVYNMLFRGVRSR